jgi:hypothetical protein
MNLPSIGLTGYIGAGKSTAATELEITFPDYYIGAFATHVKASAKDMGWDGKKDERGRQFLRAIGAAGREYDEDLWIKIETRNYHEDIPVIFDDVRYPNEAAFIRARGGIIIEVRRAGVVCDGHPSESQHIEPDYIVNNDNGIDTLRRVLIEIVKLEINKRKVQL